MFDSLARYGGEEFVVVMSGASSSDAVRAAERLRTAIQAMTFSPDGQSAHRLTVSIGLSRSARADITCESLLNAADRALYRAKRLGRNRVEVELTDEEEPGDAYLILASLNATCLRATGSYFFSSSLPVAERAFFLVT